MKDYGGVAGHKLGPRSRWRNSQIVLFNNALRAETQFALEACQFSCVTWVMRRVREAYNVTA